MPKTISFWTLDLLRRLKRSVIKIIEFVKIFFPRRHSTLLHRPQKNLQLDAYETYEAVQI